MSFKSREIKQVFDYLNGVGNLVSGERPLLKFEEELSHYHYISGAPVYWLSVYYKNLNTASPSEEPEEIKYTLLSAQSTEGYINAPDKLLLRIILRLATQLISTQQDINILMRDYKLTRK